MLEKVKNQTHVTFVGVPGSGKTATAHHIALILQQEGYEIVPIKDITKIEDYCDPEKPQVFLIDDVVGVYGLQETKLNLLSDYQDRMMKPIMPKSKTLMTCREAVYRKTLESSSFFTDENNIVLLHSEANALNHTDKKNILQVYNIDVNLLSPDSLTTASKMFPYLCKLFSTQEKFRFYGSGFFENPVPCILKELDEMEKQNKIHYVSLVLCMMNENKISDKTLKETENETVFKNLHDMKHSVFRKCKVSSQTDDFNFVDALAEMEGTYTKLCGTEYSFIHDSMFEIVAFHFGCQFPELILQFMSSSYIANYVKLQRHKTPNLDNETQEDSENIAVFDENKQNVAFSHERSDSMVLFDLCIRLRENQYSMLAERLYRDIENMELYDVFMNNVLKQSKVCQAFIEVLKTRSYTELMSLFLSVQKDVSNVVRKGKHVSRDGWNEEDREEHRRCVTLSSSRGESVMEREDRMAIRDTWKWSKHFKQSYIQSVLLNETGDTTSGNVTYSVRVISWVIYYGHSQIFQYISEQTELHKETQSQLFESDLTYKKEGGKKTTRHTPEQYRLLVLSCYSRDLETVKLLLKYVNKDSISGVPLNFCHDYSEYDTPLTVACEDGHVGVVKELLNAGADVNLKHIRNSPLAVACWGGHLGVVNELLEKGADVKRHIHEEALEKACKRGYIDIVKKLLEAGAEVNPRGFSAPLEAACSGGHINVVKELLDAGAKVNPYEGLDNSPLLKACGGGHTSVVRMLIEAGADANFGGYYDTPLSVACEGGYTSVVRILIEAGANVNLEGEYNTPLSAACEGGHMSLMNELLEAGANINGHILCHTPLGAACKSGHISIVNALLDAGADVDAGFYSTPLIAACSGGHLSIVRKLIDVGAYIRGSVMTSALEMACYGGHLSVVKELLETGADVNLQHEHSTPLIEACSGGHISVVKELLQAGANVNQQGKHCTPLLTACARGDSNVVKLLLEAGANVISNNFLKQPLPVASSRGHISIVKDLLKTGASVFRRGFCDYALRGACENGHISVVEELLEAGADPNYLKPLISACRYGYKCIVKKLIEAGADINQRYYSDTPLTAACECGHLSVVKELLEARADVNKGNGEDSPLTAACRGGHMSVVNELLKAGADVNLQSEYNTPLSAACGSGHLSVAKKLITKGADVNPQDKDKIPLIVACEGGHLKVIEELLDKEANVNAQDSVGRTPLYIAILHDIETLIPVVLLLKNYGADPTICNEEGLSPLCIALYKNKAEVVKQLLGTGNESQMKTLKLHLFDCLVKMRNSDVMSDSKDDVVLTQIRVWPIKRLGDSYETLLGRNDVHANNVLKHLLSLGLDVNQSIKLYGGKEPDVRTLPLIFVLIDESYVQDLTGKLRILLEAGVDVNVRERFSGYDSDLDSESDFYDFSEFDYMFGSESYSDVSSEFDCVLEKESICTSLSVRERTQGMVSYFRSRKNLHSMLDKEGMSVLERIRRLRSYVCKIDMLGEVRKHVRRYSV